MSKPVKGDLVLTRAITIPAGTVFGRPPASRALASEPREAVVGIGSDAVGYLTVQVADLPDAAGWLEEFKG